MNTLLAKLIRTEPNTAVAVARVTLGLVMLPHGLQKTLGLFGGYGFTGTMGYFTGTLGMSYLVALLVIASESVGAIALIVGFLSRFCAASLVIVMVGAVYMAHWANGFFMNWFGNQPGEGFEYHLLVVGLALTVVVGGAGRWSIDRALCGGCQKG
jgi:putative oxidoreductase